MSIDAQETNLSGILAQLISALEGKKISASACENIKNWLTDSRYSDYRPQVCRHIEQGKWQQLDDAFWTIIPFGTGGRRGRMYPIGSNAINDRTIGESAQGLAEYIKQQKPNEEHSCAIAYDTRHQSEHFAKLCAGIMAAAGFRLFFLDDYRSTPELSFLVRHKKCSCGIMVTASHNPPSDNAVKVYWSTGGQLLPPHDKAVIEKVMNVGQIKSVDFEQAVSADQIVVCTKEVDKVFIETVSAQGFAGPRELRILYSPLHGVGKSAVCPVLLADGFTEVEVYAEHSTPDGDFPNVPDHVSNPENPGVFTPIIKRAQQTGADLVMATDPDCDRLGCAAPITSDSSGPWDTFTGNQIAVLLADFVLQRHQSKGDLTPEHYLVKTLVTTEMVHRIGESYGVKTVGNLAVGFKWIGGVIDRNGPDKFVFGCEESHGYLVGQYARDKDGAVAAMLLAELAALLKSQGQSLHEKLDSLYWQHGYHAEKLRNQKMEGSAGMELMKALMKRFRESPPTQIGGLEVSAVRDYLSLKTLTPDGKSQALDGPQGDMVILDLAQKGNYIAVRPSGTEPKVKFYMFTYVAPELLADLETTKDEMAQRLSQMERDLEVFATAP